MRRLGLGIIAALLALPGSAGGATYCVGSPPGCTGTETSLQLALTSAGGSAENDAIVVGSGTYTGPFTYLPTRPDAGKLAVSGRGASTILEAGGVNVTVLNLLAHDGIEPKTTVSYLALRVPDGGTGVNTYGDLRSIHVAPAPGADGVTGIRTNGSASLTSVSAVLPDSGTPSTALRTETADGDLAGPVTVSALHAEAGRGIRLQNGASVVTSRIISTAAGVEACSASADVYSSVLVAVQGRGITADTQCADAPAILRVRNSTIVGEGTSSTALVASDQLARKTRIELDSSVVRGFRSSHRTAGGAVVAARYSSIDLAAAEAGSTTPAEDGGHNSSGDPRFLDAAARDYRVTWDSPTIDRGNPAAFEGDYATTILGFLRILDSDGDGVARRDMGAHEFLGPIPRITAPATAQTGELITFDASASTAYDAPLSFAWVYDDGATTVGPVVKRGFPTPGVRTVTLTVSDSAGRSATRTVTVTVTAPRGTSPTVTEDRPGAPLGADTAAPVLGEVAVRSRKRLRWTASEDAVLTITLQRCRKAKGGRCRRWAEPRTTTRLIQAGPGAMRLAQARAKGRWRVRLVATDAAGNRSPQVTANFVVKS